MRVRAKTRGTSERPRLSVSRSNKHIYAQIIDDEKAVTLASFSDAKLSKAKDTKVEKANAVGKELAGLAKKKGVTAVVFDRGGYAYHGRIKALADGARSAGLDF